MGVQQRDLETFAKIPDSPGNAAIVTLRQGDQEELPLGSAAAFGLGTLVSKEPASRGSSLPQEAGGGQVLREGPASPEPVLLSPRIGSQLLLTKLSSMHPNHRNCLPCNRTDAQG